MEQDICVAVLKKTSARFVINIVLIKFKNSECIKAPYTRVSM